jgi:hypothetical protein
VTETLVEGFEIPNYPTTPAIVRVNPFTLNGVVEVYADHLDLLGVKLNWNQRSEAITDGRIDFNPTVVSLKSFGEKVNLRDLTYDFIGIQPEGEGRIQSDVFYNSALSQAEGRTRVDARVSLAEVGLEKQHFGLLSGPLAYKENRLFIGPLKLTRGGGKADISGELWESSKGPRIRLQSQIDRIEVLSRIEGIEKDIFRGFLSGQVDLEGSTRPDDPDYLNGLLKIKTNAFSFMGIPFQRGSGEALYKNQVLKINNFVAENNNSKVSITGELQPVKGTQVLFSTESIPVASLKINSGLNDLQDAKIKVNGFWRPSVGWGVKGKVFDLYNGGRKFPEAIIEVGGDGEMFNLDVQMQNLLKLVYKEKQISPSETRITKLKTTVRDEGFYALFSYLKGWKSDSLVNSSGSLEIDWTPAEGFVKSSNLAITGPFKRDGKIGPLLNVPGEGVVSWKDGQIVENSYSGSLTSKSSTPMSLIGLSGERNLRLSAQIPAAFGELFIPNMSFLEGQLVMDAVIPMNPDINTLQIKGAVQNAILLVRGLGKPVEEFNTEVLVSGKSLFVNRGRGRLGSGEVVCNGVYRLDIEKPAASFQFNLNRAQMVLMDDVPLDVSGDVSIKGDVFPYELSGRAQVSNAVYSKEFQASEIPIGAEVEPVLRYNLDVDLLQDVRVKNSVSDLVVAGKVLLAGNDIAPDIKGKIQLISGKVFANENVFNVSQGAVDFLGGSPIVPIVNLQGTTTVKAENVDYRIDLKVRGTSNDLSFDFASDPSLETSQIINLLAFGMVKRADDSLSLTSDLAGAARVEAFQALFGKALGKNLDNTTGFQVKFRAAPDQSQKEFIPKVMVTRKLSDRVTATFGNSLDLDKPEKNFQVDYRLFNNVNLTGVWEQGANPQDSSMGMDLRFKFDLK